MKILISSRPSLGRAQDRSVEARLLAHIAPRLLNGASRTGVHVLDLERLKYEQQRLAVDQLTADLMGKVFSHVSAAELALGRLGVGLALILRAFDAPGCPTSMRQAIQRKTNEKIGFLNIFTCTVDRVCDGFGLCDQSKLFSVSLDLIF